MQNAHLNAAHTDPPFSVNLNAISIMAFCRAIDSHSAPTAELDMFSRWIKLSDDLLAADWQPRKKLANRRRRKLELVFLANPA